MKKLSIIVITIVLLLATVYTAITQTQKHRNSDLPVETSESDTTGIGVLINEDPWKELQQIVDTYSGQDDVQYKGTMTVTDDNGDVEKIIETNPFEYVVKENEYYYSLAGIEVVQRKDLLVLVDHTNRIISCSELSTMGNGLFSIDEFKNLLENAKAKVTLTVRGRERVLTIDSIQHEQIQGYRIFYDPSTYQVKRVTIGIARSNALEQTPVATIYEADPSTETTLEETDETNEGPFYYYIDMYYSSIVKNSLNGSAFNPEARFIEKNGHTITKRESYESYELMYAEPLVETVTGQ